jgi:ABC-type transport system substrate-binding protein
VRAVKWIGAACALALLLAGAISYFRPAARSADQLTVALDSDLERLDPLTIKSPKTFIVSWQIFEGLLALDENGTLIPELASKWETTDNQTWRFTIRDGVRFQNSPIFGPGGKGRAITAEDVAASYTAFCGATAYPAFLLTDILEGCADYNVGKASKVSGIRKTGPMTVELVLTHPESYFLHRLSTAWIAIFPQEALQLANKDQWGLSSVVGTGPFALVSNSDTEIKLTRNPDYWDKTAVGAVRDISFRVVRNDQARLNAVRDGSADLTQLTPTLFPAVLNPDGSLKSGLADQLRLVRYPTFNSHMIGFNVTSLPDVHLRRAISLGIDRKRIADTLFFGNARINGGTVPLAMHGYVSAIPVDSLYDPAAARKELAQSSYRGQDIELLVNDQAGSEQIGQLVQAELRAIGVNIHLTKVDFNTAVGRVVKGEAPMFSMYFDYVFSSPELILVNMFASDKRPVPNFWQYSNQKVDTELASLRTLDRKLSLIRSAEIEAKVVRDAPAAFLFELDPVLIARKGLAPIKVNAHGYFDFARLGG